MNKCIVAVQKKKESQQMRWNSLLVPCQRLFCTASEIELNFVYICIGIYRFCLCFNIFVFVFCNWSGVEDCKECTSALFQSMNHCCRVSIFWPTTSLILFSSFFECLTSFYLLTNNFFKLIIYFNKTIIKLLPSPIVLLTDNLNCQILNFKLLVVSILTINSIL